MWPAPRSRPTRDFRESRRAGVNPPRREEEGPAAVGINPGSGPDRSPPHTHRRTAAPAPRLTTPDLSPPVPPPPCQIYNQEAVERGNASLRRIYSCGVVREFPDHDASVWIVAALFVASFDEQNEAASGGAAGGGGGSGGGDSFSVKLTTILNEANVSAAGQVAERGCRRALRERVGWRGSWGHEREGCWPWATSSPPGDSGAPSPLRTNSLTITHVAGRRCASSRSSRP